MKKFLTIISLILAMFVFVSCVEDDEEDTVSGDNTPAGDTTPSENGDTNPSDTGNTTPAETGDTNPADDTGDTTSAETGDTTPSDQADTTSAETGDTTPGGCTPQCDGKECGSDGCGGQCGTCGEGRICDAGTFTCKCTGTCDGIHCGAGTDNGCGEPCGCKSNETCGEETGLCECAPQCEGKECGPDGCGGFCGEYNGGCKEDEVCTAAQTCKGCTTITLSPVKASKNNNGYLYYRSETDAYTPNTGDPSKDDKYVIVFKSSTVPETGTPFDLSGNIDNCDVDNSTYKTLCFYIIEDHKNNNPKTFLPKTGTITVNSYEEGSQISGNGAKINADISGIKFGEIIQTEEAGTILDPGLKITREFVEGGDCLIVEDANLSYE